MKASKLTSMLLSICALAQMTANAKSIATASGAPPGTSKFEQGVKYLENFESDKAIGCFSRALLQSPPSSTAFRAKMFVMIGRAFQTDENEVAALQAFSVANQLKPNDQMIVGYLADALERCEHYKEAVLYFNWLKNQKIKTRQTLEILSTAEFRRSDFKKAKSYVDAALANPANKNDAHLLVISARLLTKLGLSNSAAEQFRKASEASASNYLKDFYKALACRIDGKSDEELDALKDAGKILPEDPIWHTELAEYYARNGNQRLAIEHYNAAMSKRVSTRAFQRTVGFLKQERRFSDALKVSDYLIKVKPWSPDGYQLKGSTYLTQKDYKNAVEQFKRALSKDDHLDGTYSDLARCYQEENQFELARQTYKKALVNCPTSTATWRKFGNFESQHGSREDAQHCFEKVLALTSDSLDQSNVLIQNEAGVAHARLGCYYYQDHKYDKALSSAKLFNKLKFVPKLPGILTLIHLRPGRLPEGTTAQETEYLNHMLLADMLREGNRLDDCIAEYRKAEALNSDDIDLHSFLLSALDEKGDTFASAKEDFVLSTKLVNKVPAEIKRFTDQKPAIKPAVKTPSESESLEAK
jgi:tetratricopeptide (TPR) repeat protein